MINNEIKIKNALIVLAMFFFAFQRAFISLSNIFGYFDEILSILCLADLLIKLIQGKLKKIYLVMLFLMLMLLSIGLLSNSISDLLNIPVAIIVDIISTFKIFIIFISFATSNLNKDKIIKMSGKIGILLTYIMFFFLILSSYIDIGMKDTGERYGLNAFKFVFNNAGNFSKFFYFLVPLLIINLKYSKSLNNYIAVFISLILWASTLRSRAFAFIAIIILLYIIFFLIKPKKIKLIYLLPILVVVLFIVSDQLVFYFTNDTQARNLLFQYSILTMKNYFPFGSGFGTYGSDIAIVYYSKLYLLYGFDNIYGMGYIHTGYLNDNYWPMILGQFGIFGLILMALLIFLIYKQIYKESKFNKINLFSSTLAMIFLLLSSVASKSYSEFSSICIFMLFAMLCNEHSKRCVLLTGKINE